MHPLVTPGLGLIFWSALTFLIVLFVLSKYAWRPILNAVKEREQSIDQALRSAEKARDDMAKLHAENEKLLDEARLERDKILKNAQVAATTIVNDAKTKASEEGSKILESARAAIQIEKQAALAEIKTQVATLSVQIAEKLLRKELNTEKAQQELVSEYVSDLKLN
ncbi:MAG TPA: F0F1 ATP synthase subunit B [Cytophagales bacterium]|nr:F0F1 ATP synthase subunit B [Cytophagales bacterium]